MPDTSKTSSVKVHFFYVTLILVLTIVGLVTHKWTGIAEFREYLTVGATVTSLVLGILAIIYSFVSTGQQSSALGSIGSAASAAEGAVAKLDGFMARAEQLQDKAGQRTNDLHELTKALSASVGEIKDETTALVTANREVAGKVNLLPEQLGELKGILQTSAKSSVPAAPQVNSAGSAPQWTPEAVASALSVSSAYGLGVIDACTKAHEFKKELSTSALAKAVASPDEGYFAGYLIAFASSFLVRLSSNKAMIFQVPWVHPSLDAAVEAEWKKRDAAAKTPEAKSMLAVIRAAVFQAIVESPVNTPIPTPAPV